MKPALGRVWILLFFIVLQAEDFSHHFSINNATPYVKEPVILTLDLNQTNHDMVLLFDFDIIPSDSYTFQRIGIKESDAHHAIGIHYTYLLYPLHDGTIDIAFKLTKKVTTDDSVAYSFSGDRDNVKGLVTKDYQITLPMQKLEVRPLPKGTQLVGDFTLSHILQKHNAKAYETLPLQITLKGRGYPPVLDNLIAINDNFTLFKEKPLVQSSIVNQETQSTIIYPMALSAKQSFTLTALEIQAFNPKNQKIYTLTLPEQIFNIASVDTHSLVDKVDAPPPFKADFQWFKNLFSYLLVFMAGFLTAYLLKWENKSTQKEANPLIEKIKQIQETKALLQLLMSTDSQRFSSCIEVLETAYYKDGKINLSKVKKEAIDLI